MKGRKQDTRLLVIVLTLCFLFITLSNVVLSSIQVSREEQRIARHGRFQAIAFDVDEDALKTYQSIAQQTSTSLILGPTQKNGLLGTIDQDFMELGALQLKEGRLPEKDNEIVLTQSAMEALTEEKQVGDHLSLVLELGHVGDKAVHLPTLRYGIPEEIYLRSQQEITPEDRAAFEAYYDERYGVGAAHFNQPFTKAADLDERSYQLSLNDWLYGPSGVSYVRDISSGRREPFHMDELTMVLHHRTNGFELYGSRWGEDRGTRVELDTIYERLLVAGDYAIVGVLGAYSDQWAKGDFILPEVFVSNDGAGKILETVNKVEQAHPQLPHYLPPSLMLLYNPSLSAEQLYDQALAAAGDRRHPSYQLTDLETSGGGIGTDVVGGHFLGLDEKTGKERQLSFYVVGGVAKIWNQGENYLAPLPLVLEGRLRLPGLLPLPLEELTVENAQNLPGLPLQRNAYTYPSEADAGGTLQRLLPLLMSLLTFTAVLQIFLTQLRRRARRLALLKALGATRGQVAGMLLLEACFLLFIALPLGTALGLALSFGAVEVLKAFQGADSVQLHWPVLPLIKALLLGALALFVGVLLPLIQAMRIPLSGRFEQQSPTPKRLKTGGTQQKLTYNRMVWRNALANPERSLLGFVLAVLIVLSPLTTLFLGYHAFTDYRLEVVDKDRPDYVLSMPYGMNARILNEHVDRLNQQLPGLERVQPWLYGGHIGLEVTDLVEGKSPVLSALYAREANLFGRVEATKPIVMTTEGGFQAGGMTITVAPGMNLSQEDIEALLASLPITQEEIEAMPSLDDLSQEEQDDLLANIEQAPVAITREVTKDESKPLVYYTSLWALDPQNSLLPRLMEEIDLGKIDEEAFKKGEEAILVVPRYQMNGDELLQSHHPRDKQGYLVDEGIQPGDVLNLHTQSIALVGDDRIQESLDGSVRVAAIIHDYSLPGIWPLSDSNASHVLIGSQKLLTKVYPQASARMSAQQARWHRLAVETFFPYNYGQTYLMVNAQSGTDRESGDIALLNFARENALDLKNHRTANQALYSLAVNSALLIALLGSAVFLIALVIFSSALHSAIQQEKKRFGILQSMGVTERKMLRGQAGYGFVVGLLAVLVANLLLALLVVIVTALQLPQGVSLLAQLQYITLRGYPFLAHGLICLVFVLVSALMHAWPLRSIARQTAISNILDTNLS